MSLRVLKEVDIQARIGHLLCIDPRSKAGAHDMLNDVAFVLKHLEVLLSVEILPRQRHNQMRVLLEMNLLLAQQVQAHFKPKRANVVLVAPNGATHHGRSLQKVVLHKLRVA